MDQSPSDPRQRRQKWITWIKAQMIHVKEGKSGSWITKVSKVILSARAIHLVWGGCEWIGWRWVTPDTFRLHLQQTVFAKTRKEKLAGGALSDAKQCKVQRNVCCKLATKVACCRIFFRVSESYSLVAPRPTASGPRAFGTRRKTHF